MCVIQAACVQGQVVTLCSECVCVTVTVTVKSRIRRMYHSMIVYLCASCLIVNARNSFQVGRSLKRHFNWDFAAANDNIVKKDSLKESYLHYIKQGKRECNNNKPNAGKSIFKLNERLPAKVNETVREE